jgi:hypothetical protein
VKPGDVVTCKHCGAQAVATWTSLERPWQEGWALLLTWTHGPHPRQEAVVEAPKLCLWCLERCSALGADAPPLYRPKDPPAQADAAPAASAPSAAGPLDRYEALARAYHDATGRWPYGYPLSALNSGEQIDRDDAPWRAWCAARAAAARPQPKPKGQFELFTEVRRAR